MNIYLIVEDGETFCMQAPTMHSALKICETDYLNERYFENNKLPIDTKEELEYYHEQILKSCSFVGELKNNE